MLGGDPGKFHSCFMEGKINNDIPMIYYRRESILNYHTIGTYACTFTGI